MTTPPDRERYYLTTIPADSGRLPAGIVVVHNHVKPRRRLGSSGFRAWLDRPNSRIERCDCGWAPELDGHYRAARVPPEFPAAGPDSPDSALRAG